MDARNILLRRQTAFSFVAEAKLKAPVLADGQESGITCYYDENTWVCFYISKRGGEYFLQVKEHIGRENILHEKTVIEDPAGKQYLLGVETDYLNRRFYYKEEESDVTIVTELSDVYYLCDEGIRMGKRFTGAMVGMYGYAGDIPLYTEFIDFNYTEK